ncbi:unnamed protein product [marine sediment metagenome]|uniref:Uncharacterized protein n=1 Tax=marine sediment metagenome TaxID=412755 RepID=X1FGN3_9ZZZZ
MLTKKQTKEKILKAFSFKKGGIYLMLYRYDANIQPKLLHEVIEQLSENMGIKLYSLGVFDVNDVKFADLKKINIREK